MRKASAEKVRTGEARPCMAEPLEERVLMAAALARGGSGYSGTLSTSPTLRTQQLICDPPEPVQGQTSVLYDASKVTLRAANAGPGYANGDFHGFIEVLLSGRRQLIGLETYFTLDENERPPETGYVQIYFTLSGQAGQISPNTGYTVMDDGGADGVDTHQLMFDLKPDMPDDTLVAYTIMSAPQNMRSGNAADYLAYQAADGSVQRLEYTQLSPATVSNANAITYLRGSNWTPAFRSFIAAAGIGRADFGYRLIPRGDLPEAPWTNIDQITFDFSDALPSGYLFSAGRVRVLNTLSGQTYPVQSATFNASTGVGVIQLTAPLPAGTFRVSLDLDANNFPDREAVFSVIPGDVDRSGRVNATDLVVTRNRIGRTTQNVGTGAGAYTPFTDVNGDGAINATDLVLVRNRVGAATRLQAPSFTPTASLFADRRVRVEADDGELFSA